MIYEVVFDARVYAIDFRPIDVGHQQRIVKEVRRKLSAAPDRFGKPLGKELRGYRRLRVGDYRVIYRVERKKAMVLVMMVIHRRTKYRGVRERISRGQKNG